jgi:MFS family permease
LNSPDQLGFAAAISQVIVILITPIGGRLADRIGHRFFPILSGTLYGILAILLAHTTHITQIYGIAAGVGFCFGSFWPSMEASTGEDLHGSALLKSLAIFNLSWGLGITLGPGVLGAMYGKSPMHAFALSAALTIAAGVAVLFHPGGSNEVQPETHASSKVAVLPFAGQAFMIAAWIGNFGAWFCGGVLRNLFQSLGKQLGLVESQIGLLMLLWALAMTVMFVSLGFSTRWTYRTSPLLVFEALVGVGFLVLFKASTFPVLATGVIIAGIGIGMVYSSSLYYSSDGHADKGAKCGLHEMILGAGALTGPLTGGLAARYFSLRAPFLLCAVMMGMCLITGMMVLRARKRVR